MCKGPNREKLVKGLIWPKRVQKNEDFQVVIQLQNNVFFYFNFKEKVRYSCQPFGYSVGQWDLRQKEGGKVRGNAIQLQYKRAQKSEPPFFLFLAFIFSFPNNKITKGSNLTDKTFFFALYYNQTTS